MEKVDDKVREKILRHRQSLRYQISPTVVSYVYFELKEFNLAPVLLCCSDTCMPLASERPSGADTTALCTQHCPARIIAQCSLFVAPARTVRCTSAHCSLRQRAIVRCSGAYPSLRGRQGGRASPRWASFATPVCSDGVELVVAQVRSPEHIVRCANLQSSLHWSAVVRCAGAHYCAGAQSCVLPAMMCAGLTHKLPLLGWLCRTKS